MENTPILNSVKEESNFDIKQEEVTFELIEELNGFLPGVDEDILNKTEKQEEESCLPDFGTQVLIKTEVEEIFVSNEETEESVISNEMIDTGDGMETVKKEDGSEDQSNPMEFTFVKVEWEGEEEWEECLGQEADPLNVYHPVKIKVETQLIKEEDDKEEDMTMSDTSPSTSQDMVQCDQDGSSSFTMLTQHKDQRITCSQINLISDCKTLKKINSSLNEKPFNVNKIYKDRMRVHSVPKLYKCSQCDYSSAWSSCKHMSKHTNEKPFKCLQCDYSCERSFDLKQHMTVHTGDEPFKCLLCDYSSAWSSCLKTHMIVHRNGKKFKCLQCDYSCGRTTELKKHMNIHRSEKPFKCLQCDYSSAWSSCIKKHMIIHTREKPFKCLQCDYSSAWSSCLNKHMIAHRRENKFKCLQCDYSCARSTEFKKHMNVHRSEKPFKCLQCDYSSASSRCFKKHMTVHTSEKPFKCL